MTCSDERTSNLGEHADALRATRSTKDLEAVWQVASRACVALAFRATDAMIGLDEVDPELVDQVHDLAVEALERCAAAGNGQAWHLLGERWLEHGDRTRALAAFTRAADAGDDEAALQAARLVWSDRREDHGPRAAAWLERVAAASGDGEAERLRGYLAFHGLDEPEADRRLATSAARLQRSHDWHVRAAAKGDADAMFELHVFHAKGLGPLEADQGEAMRWCARAAEAGSARAMANLGGFHATGAGLPKDLERAVHWYTRAAESGHGRAAATLGVMLALGGEVPKDEPRAREWFARADRLGFEWDPLARSAGLDPAAWRGTPPPTARGASKAKKVATKPRKPAAPKKKKKAAASKSKKTAGKKRVGAR